MGEKLTATLFVCSVVTVYDAVAHLLLGDAHLADAAVEVMFRAVGAIELVGKVGAVDDAVTDAMRLADVTHFSDAT